MSPQLISLRTQIPLLTKCHFLKWHFCYFPELDINEIQISPRWQWPQWRFQSAAEGGVASRRCKNWTTERVDLAAVRQLATRIANTAPSQTLSLIPWGCCCNSPTALAKR